MTHEKGFTLVEIIIVLGILIAIISFGMTIDWHVLKTDNFQTEEATIVALLSKARSHAMSNAFESAYGFCYIKPNYIIFRAKESNCKDGEPTNELIPANIEIASNPLTTFPIITFDQLSGNTTGGTIHIEDGIKKADIVINYEGAINW